MIKKDVIIIGAGAAGLMCAAEAGKRGRSVVVLEKSDKPGKKILISGGGRCNFTNIYTSPENFICGNPHFHKSALASYTPEDFISLVNKYQIAFHEKKLGQMFCDKSSNEILVMLLSECKKNNAELITDIDVKEIRKKDSFEIVSGKEIFKCESLVIASGGISIPKMGATDFGYRTARTFGIKVTQTRPGLAPLLFGNEEKKLYSHLSGISADCIISCNKVKFRENLLFTHKGLSGPAILQASSYLNPGDHITINLLPEIDLKNIITENSNAELSTVLKKYLPERYVNVFTENFYKSKKVNTISAKDLQNISDKLQKWNFVPLGTEGFDKAEVTVGGIDTDELSSKTMESKKVKGLYFIGEVVDVTGWLGGYNFQWAWSSGFAAGKYV
ncbi:MAG: hypothetical protein HGGPFJEG_02214 [Ignavibacteria bacterium]|nr:hypothetical protein [Ignavibacteria bacterium]